MRSRFGYKEPGRFLTVGTLLFASAIGLLPGNASARQVPDPGPGIRRPNVQIALLHRPRPPRTKPRAPAPQAPSLTPDQRLILQPLPAGIVRVDPTRGPYPVSSLADYSSLLNAPAGRFGFLKAGDDGHFHWADGRRARFWGVSISRRSILISHAEIARVAATLARSGCNIVRFEAIDGPGGILDGSSTDSQHLSAPFLDALQFWIACLRARGVYYYLDLLDFRRFLPGDDVPNAAALGIAGRPYAIFDPRLIELQKEYATQLLTTVNPYTHLRPVDDPALVMVELINEHGLFSSVTEIHKLAEPYNGELQKLWNDWLLHHYGSRDALAAHWKAASVPLQTGEDPTGATVRLQAMPPSESGWDRGGVRSARIRDQVDFLADTQRAFFRDMRDTLRGMGLRCPITASVTSVVGPDVLSVADELDCTTGNFYADHPKFSGADWTGPVYYNNDNQLRDSEPQAVAPQIAVLRWNNRPVIIREWCTAWPNQYRATAVPDMAAYAALQDVDMVLAFTYVAGTDTDRLLDFAIQSDPTFWGLFGAGARIFLAGLVAPARYSVDLVYSSYDLEHWGPFFSQLHRLSWCSRVRNVVNGAVSPPVRGISVLSGRGGWAAMPTQNSLIFQRLDAVPPPDREASVQNILSSNKLPLASSPLTTQDFHFDGLIYDPGTHTVQTQVGFSVPSLQAAGYKPVGVDDVGEVAFGAYDPSRQFLVLPVVTSVEGLRASLDLLHQVGADTTHDEIDVNHWHSDTGQITRNSDAGRLIVTAPECAIAAGEFPPESPVYAGLMNLRTGNPDGALVMVSLDHRPLESSQAWSLKMVTHAQNTGQDLEPAPPNSPGAFTLKETGTAPVQTGGLASAQSTTVSLGSRLLARVYLTGGTWELLRQGNQYTFTCDTPGVRVQLGRGRRFFAVSAAGKWTPMPVNPDGSFIYPAGLLAVVAVG